MSERAALLETAYDLVGQSIVLAIRARDQLQEAGYWGEGGEMTGCLCILRDVHAMLSARARDLARGSGPASCCPAAATGQDQAADGGARGAPEP